MGSKHFNDVAYQYNYLVTHTTMQLVLSCVAYFNYSKEIS